MAVDIFLKLDDVKGDSVDDKHKGEIIVSSFTWGVTQRGGAHSGPGGGTGRADVADLTITKNVCPSSPLLFTSACQGKHFAKGLLTVRKAGPKPLEYMKITMNDIIITGVNKSLPDKAETCVETVSLNFASFSYEYTPQQGDGTGGASIVKGFHIASNVAT